MQRGGIYDDDYDETDHFKELLNSSPKKSQKNNTHKKEREWEQLEAQTDKKRQSHLHAFDDLLDEPQVTEDFGSSPTMVNKDLTSELMKERKASVLNQGISLIPMSMKDAQMLEQRSDKRVKPQGSMMFNDDHHHTETTKANGRSKLDHEDSIPGGDMLYDDDDEFDKLIGRITNKAAVMPRGATSTLPPIYGYDPISSSKESTQRQHNGRHIEENEDFF